MFSWLFGSKNSLIVDLRDDCDYQFHETIQIEGYMYQRCSCDEHSFYVQIIYEREDETERYAAIPFDISQNLSIKKNELILYRF
jgi:hypothetical protein